ncbi:hypothetical protein OCGS_2569 [Oceaniovalibus guishaninsula JLT2003]|uniref:Uncharacterized protein n=1 Tax=Oceaniovalibus guishaninsula JLT2003 TaxID=1231392 RepID=K2H9R9_9RHOB|nr:hypothetical protein OCGS_2569 [Oceaniovalibus guishaninsula JLT2003]
MLQEGAFAGGADARHIVQRRCTHGLGPFGAVGADGEAMRLVPQALDEIEHRIVVPQRHDRLARAVKLLLAGVAVDALGDADHGDVIDPQIAHDRRHRADLSRAAVDQQQIGPMAFLPVGIFLQQALEAAGQNLFHHAEIVAGRQVGALDVELAILVLHQPLGPRHDHAAHGIRALDVAVVVNLDPLRRRVQIEGFGQSGQQTGLGRGFAHPARQAFAGVAQGTGHEILLFAPLGHKDLDAPPRLFRQRVLHQVAILDLVGQQQHARRFAGVVELADETGHHLGRVGAAAGARIIIAVAPVLVGADEEHLHAGLPALHMQRDHVGFGHAFGVDALAALHLGQGADPVAQGGGALELHRGAGLLHLAGKLGLHLGGAALEEVFGILDQRAIIAFADLADARGAAPLDLVKQAGPGTGFEHRIGAVAQQEHALQLRQRPVDRPRTGEGAVIIALLGLGAAMLLDLRKGMVAGHEDIRERLVVAQQHVVAGLELLDEVLFEQQRLGLRPRRQEHHRRGFADHAGDAGAVPRRPGIVRHPRAQVAGLADVKNGPLFVQHPVDARRAVETAQIGLHAGVTAGAVLGLGRRI